jgi:hypothetical protein
VDDDVPHGAHLGPGDLGVGGDEVFRTWITASPVMPKHRETASSVRSSTTKASSSIPASEVNNNPSTVYAKRWVLREHLAPAFGKRRLDEIGPAEIEAYKARKLKDGQRRSR